MAITTALYSQDRRQVTTFTETGVSTPFRMAESFDASVQGVTAGGGSAKIQRCYDNPLTAASVFRDVASYTADDEETGSHGASIGAWYRWNVTYVGGTVVCEFRK